MKKITFENVSPIDAGNDVLLIGAVRVCQFDESDSEEDRAGEVPTKNVIAKGWVSATTNHFPPDCYDKNPPFHRKDSAVARSMTTEEKNAYCLRLLTEQYGSI